MTITREEFVALSAELLAKANQQGLIEWLFTPDEQMRSMMSAESKAAAMMAYMSAKQHVTRDPQVLVAYFNVVMSAPNIIYKWSKSKDGDYIDIDQLFSAMMQFMMFRIVTGPEDDQNPIDIDGLGSVHYVEDEGDIKRPLLHLENFDFNEEYGGLLYAMPAPICPRVFDLYLEAFKERGWI